MPFGTVTADDITEILQTTKCVSKIKAFHRKRGRELKIWGPPEMLSFGYAKTFEKVRKNGDTGGRKSKEEQEEVNKEFVKTYPRGCHKRKSISTTDEAPTPMTTPTPDDEPTPPQEAPMAAKTKMPNEVKTKQSKKEEGARMPPWRNKSKKGEGKPRPAKAKMPKTPIVLDLFNEIPKVCEEHHQTPWHKEQGPLPPWHKDRCHHGTRTVATMAHMFWSAQGPLPPWHKESPPTSTWCSSPALEMMSCPSPEEFIPGLGAVPLFEQIPASEEPPLPLQPPPGCPEKPPLGKEYVSWGFDPNWPHWPHWQ